MAKDDQTHGGAPHDAPYDVAPGGVRLRVRLTPRGGREGLDGVVQLADGRWALKLRVSAPPVDGAANAAVIAFAAKGLGLAKSHLEIVAGQTSRLKSLRIEGDPADLVARLSAWMTRG